MKLKNFFMIISILSVGLWAQASEESEVKAMIEENNKEAFEVASKGLTEAEKVKLKLSMDELKKLQDRVLKMSPAELKAEQNRAEEAMRSPANQEKNRQAFDNMSAEDKKMLEKMLINLKEKVETLEK